MMPGLLVAVIVGAAGCALRWLLLPADRPDFVSKSWIRERVRDRRE